MENFRDKLIPHQGCTLRRTRDGDIEVFGAGQNWIMAAAVLSQVWRAPFIFRIVGKTDSTNLRMYWHKGELIFNWEHNVRELRTHDPLDGSGEGFKDKGFITPGEWHTILWHIRPDGMTVSVDEALRHEASGNYKDIASAPSVGPCFGSTVTIREFSVYAP